MNENELREFFRVFIMFLRESGLGWVLRKVISDGDEMDDAEIDSSLLDFQSLRQNVQDVFNALEIVLVETVQMEVEIRDFFMSEITDENRYQILDIPQSNTSILINDLAKPQRREASNQIKTIIDELKGLIG